MAKNQKQTIEKEKYKMKMITFESNDMNTVKKEFNDAVKLIDGFKLNIKKVQYYDPLQGRTGVSVIIDTERDSLESFSPGKDSINRMLKYALKRIRECGPDTESWLILVLEAAKNITNPEESAYTEEALYSMIEEESEMIRSYLMHTLDDLMELAF